MNSGAVVVESWASHTPVIQSDVVDPNLVEEGVNGFLFEANNSDDLARKLVVAYENSSDSKQLAINGNKLVQEKFNYDYLLSLYEKTYSEILM